LAAAGNKRRQQEVHQRLNHNNRKPTAAEPQWSQFKQQLRQAQAEKQRQQCWARQWQTINELEQQINPPQLEPVSEVSEPEPYHLGSPFFDATNTRW
jgi:hypothetical protein